MRSIRIAFAALALGAPLAAQDPMRPMANPPGPVTIGGFVGFLSNALSGEDVQGSTRTTGIQAGGEIEIHGIFGFGPRNVAGFGAGTRTGIGIAQRGGGQSGSGFTDEVTSTYVEVPMVINLQHQRPGAAPFFGAGVIVGLNTGCSFEGTSGGSTFSGECTEASSTMMAVTANGGVRIPFRRGHFNLRASVDRGLTNMEKNFKAVISSFSFSVGYNTGVSF